MVQELRLTPDGVLRWEGDTTFPALQAAFGRDWREGLFALGAERSSLAGHPTLAYWQELPRRYLTGLCHLPEGTPLPSPPDEELDPLVASAPPMLGAEYLSRERLEEIWTQLDRWARETIRQSEGLDNFLAVRAPRWRQVGRVYFHLAENKTDEERPFAFLATYTTGVGGGGRLKHIPLRKSLEQYAGARNRAALIKLLSPIQAAGQSCPWVQQMVESGEVYQALAWTVDKAYELLRSAAQLEESGISVLLPNWWKKRPRPRVSVTVGPQKPGEVNAAALLEFDVQVALEDHSLSKAELAALLAGPEGLVRIRDQWVEFDREKLQQALDHWTSLQKRADKGEVSFIEGMRLLAGASEDLKAEGPAGEDEHSWVHLEAGDELRQVLAGMRHPEALKASDPGSRLHATLREYQRTGVSWMSFLTQLGLGACLADDMGLGKTIQVLALLLTQKRSSPSLLVVPASLLGNWRAEAQRFAPDLKLLFSHPAEASKETLASLESNPQDAVEGVDLVVTTYSMLSRQGWLREISWHTVILDEAQAIKNAGTRQAQAVKKLAAKSRIALTGTPVENRLGDLWSLFDFLNPGLLGSASTFSTFARALQTREHNPYAPLRQLVGPYILRRLKTDRSIIADLPDKIETVSYCGLTRPQVKLYEKALDALKESLASTSGVARKGAVLRSLMALKQICNHPSQFSGEGDYTPAASGKFQRLAEICQELAERQERALIFTQFREIIDPLADYLAGIFGAPGLVLHGGTGVKHRQKLVERFQADDGPPFFLLSLKAGGTGLNLTRASHVIHFDRWWNPAVENQATDRAFRIGQVRNVQVHKFVTRGTVEERIDVMISGKQALAQELLSGEAEVSLTELSDDDLLAMVRLDVTQAFV